MRRRRRSGGCSFKRSCLRRHGAEVDANNHLLHGRGGQRGMCIQD